MARLSDSFDEVVEIAGFKKHPISPRNHMIRNAANVARHNRHAGYDSFLHGVWAVIHSRGEQKEGRGSKLISHFRRSEISLKFNAPP